MNQVDFKQKLREQLGFLRTSAERYDGGAEMEAQRIAGIIRVLMYDKPRNSTSLLTHLDAWHICIPSTCPPNPSPKTIAHQSHLSQIILNIFPNADGSQGASAKCIAYGPSKFKSTIPAAKWWEERVYLFIDGTAYRRQDLIMVAANRDGGSHVDATLPPIYAYLATKLVGVSTASNQDGNEVVLKLQLSLIEHQMGASEIEIRNVQYSDLRQMAHELLNCTDLLALAD